MNNPYPNRVASSFPHPANGTAAAPVANGEDRAHPAPAPPEKKEFLQQRLLSLDTYRGFIMVALAFTGFGLADTARRYLQPEKAPPGLASEEYKLAIAPETLKEIRHQFDHVEWGGCAFWD